MLVGGHFIYIARRGGLWVLELVAVVCVMEERVEGK